MVRNIGFYLCIFLKNLCLFKICTWKIKAFRNVCSVIQNKDSKCVFKVWRHRYLKKKKYEQSCLMFLFMGCMFLESEICQEYTGKFWKLEFDEQLEIQFLTAAARPKCLVSLGNRYVFIKSLLFEWLRWKKSNHRCLNF